MIPPWLPALLLAVQPTPIREQAAALAADPVANRGELVALGPGAIRPLLDLKRRELEPVLFDLKFAGAGAEAVKEKLKTSSVTFTAKDLTLSGAVRLAAAIARIPILVDPGLDADAGACRVTLDLQDVSLKNVLDQIGSRAGLDYGWARGLIVMSTPERLWSAPAEPVRRLAEDELARVRGWIDQLSDPSLPVRARASLSLEAAGAAALPHLEEAARDGELERRVRLRDAILKIRRSREPGCFDRLMTVERQELTAAGRAVLQSLRDHAIEGIDLSDVPLSAALPVVLAPCHVEVAIPVPAGNRRIACAFDGQRALDVLFLLTAPHGLDAGVKDGKLVIDTRERLPAALSDR